MISKGNMGLPNHGSISELQRQREKMGRLTGKDIRHPDIAGKSFSQFIGIELAVNQRQSESERHVNFTPVEDTLNSTRR